jgi:hypothetical protein
MVDDMKVKLLLFFLTLFLVAFLGNKTAYAGCCECSSGCCGQNSSCGESDPPTGDNAGVDPPCGISCVDDPIHDQGTSHTTYRCSVSGEWNETCSAMLGYVQTPGNIYYDPTSPAYDPADETNGAYFKVLPDCEGILPSNGVFYAGATRSVTETDFFNDYIAWDAGTPSWNKPLIGFMNTLTAFPDNNYFDQGLWFCKYQHRAYGFIYIPTGVFKFGAAANHSTTASVTHTMTSYENREGSGCNRVNNPVWVNVATCNAATKPCYYCGEGNTMGICHGEGTVGQLPTVYMMGGQPCDPGEDGPNCKERAYCDVNAYYSLCKPNCGGGEYLYVAKNGGGTSVSHYSPQASIDGQLEEDFPSFSWGPALIAYDGNNVVNDEARSDGPGDDVRTLTRQIGYCRFETYTINVTDLQNTNCNKDKFWSGEKYFDEGWYPVQMAGWWHPYDRVTNPKILWMQKNVATGVWGPEREYRNDPTTADGSIRACTATSISPNCNLSLSGVPSTINGGSRLSNLTYTNSAQLDGKPSSPVVSVNFSFRLDSDNSVTNLIAVNPNPVVPNPVLESGDSGTVPENTTSTQEVETDTKIRISAIGTTAGGITCTSNTITTTLVNVGAWWQVVGADVTSLGVISSVVPNVGGVYFDEKGLGVFPGIPVGESVTTDPGNISTPNNWKAETDSYKALPYSYNYFYNLALENAPTLNSEINSIADFDEVTDENGYEWYLAKGNFDLSSDISMPVSGRKIILLVGDPEGAEEGNVTISKDIDMGNTGNSMFMIIAKGSIIITPSVNHLDGVFIGNQFTTQTADPDSETLEIDGSVVGRASISAVTLGRNLGSGNDDPAERFTYDPGLLMNIPYIFNGRTTRWKEVAP